MPNVYIKHNKDVVCREGLEEALISLISSQMHCDEADVAITWHAYDERAMNVGKFDIEIEALPGPDNSRANGAKKLGTDIVSLAKDLLNDKNVKPTAWVKILYGGSYVS